MIVAAASLATAAAVSVSGLIGFVGIIVPHTVRLVAGASYRVDAAAVVALRRRVPRASPTSSARTDRAPAEVPIGVITAFVGAPFFILVLSEHRRRHAA